MQDPRYPIGHFEHNGPITDNLIETWVEDIETLPDRVRAAVDGLSDAQLDTPYRPGGWTVRQVVHHISDSHLNCYIRFKWALTEETPTIKPYDEVAWARLGDYRGFPMASSLDFLTLLHERWGVLLRSLSREDLSKRFHHPDTDKLYSLDWSIGSYAWHGRHHLAHITTLKETRGW